VVNANGEEWKKEIPGVNNDPKDLDGGIVNAMNETATVVLALIMIPLFPF
jgi:hypothetical protein